MADNIKTLADANKQRIDPRTVIGAVDNLQDTLDSKQPKLTSANQGTGVTITEEGGVVKISSTATGNIEDVKVNNTSVVTDHVANISAVTGIKVNDETVTIENGVANITINDQDLPTNLIYFADAD